VSQGHDPTPPRLPRLRPNPPPALPGLLTDCWLLCRQWRPAACGALRGVGLDHPLAYAAGCNNPVPNRQQPSRWFEISLVGDHRSGPRYERRGPSLTRYDVGRGGEWVVLVALISVIFRPVALSLIFAVLAPSRCRPWRERRRPPRPGPSPPAWKLARHPPSVEHARWSTLLGAVVAYTRLNRLADGGDRAPAAYAARPRWCWCWS